MTQDADRLVAVVLGRGGKTVNGFGEGLVNRLIESSNSGRVGTLVLPEAKYTRAKRTYSATIWPRLKPNSILGVA